MISLPDLGHEKPSLEELVEQAKGFNREAGTGLLARLNLYLSLAILSGDDKIRIDVQEKLTRQVLSAARMEEIQKTFADRGLYDKWVLLHRAQLLVGIKLVTLYGREDGGNCLKVDNDLAKIGEFILAISSFYGPSLREPNVSMEDAIARMAAEAELYNLPLVVNGLVRIRTILGPILQDYRAERKLKDWPPPFERIFTLLNGINFRDFLDITFYLHVEQSQMLDKLLEAKSMVYVDISAPNRYVSGRHMRAWAELVCTGYEEIDKLGPKSEGEPTFFYDFSLFRRYPLLRKDDRRYFCVDAMFLAERLSSFGFYWTVINGLVDEELRSSFQRVWGELLEEYVRRLVGGLCAHQDGAFRRRPTYADDGTEVFDSAIVLENCLIAMEMKSSVIPVYQKYTGRAEPFFEGLSAKFGKGQSAAVGQLLRNIGQLFSAARPRASPSIPVGQIREVFPVVVVHESILRLGLAAHSLVCEFGSGLSKLSIRPDLRIHPLQVVEVEELERLEPYVQEHVLSLEECLRAKAHDDPEHRMGLWQFIGTQYMPARGIRSIPNKRMNGIFEWLTKASTWRVYRGDYFDPTLASRGKASDRALICARPIGADRLLCDEVIAYSEHASVEEAYETIEELVINDFPKQEISADAFECAVVDEFGFMLPKPSERGS